MDERNREAGQEDRDNVVPTQYDVVLEIPRQTSASIPALTLMLNEDRSGGWSGTVRVNPRLLSAEHAVQTLLHDGLLPGAAVLVKLVIAGNTGHAGIAARVWPSVVTSVNATGSTNVDESDALCVVSFRDPITYLRLRPVYAAYVDCSLGETLGGILSAANGGDGKPTPNPVLPGLPIVRIHEDLRDELDEIPYAVAVGEPLGYWLNRVCGRLGVRLEMLGGDDGIFHLWLRDGAPSTGDLNRDGGIDMTFDPDLDPSATNLTLSELGVNSASSARGGLLDNLSAGGAKRFGPAGALESVLTASETDLDEAERRAGFRQSNHRLAQVQATVTSCQPGLLPGRIVAFDRGSASDDEATGGPEVEGNEDEAYSTLLGASRWQVVDVAHLCVQARYWNQASVEKTGLAWRPALPDEEGAAIVSGIVDDGTSDTGELIERDRMGRIPIRFPFVHEAPTDAESDAATGDSLDVPWPPLVPIAPVVPGAGNLHGFVSDHRQGDWCRVAVVNPLYAEVVGFCHRDDRYLSESVRDATVGIVMREGQDDEWRGMLFRPEEDLEDELEAGEGD